MIANKYRVLSSKFLDHVIDSKFYDCTSRNYNENVIFVHYILKIYMVEKYLVSIRDFVSSSLILSISSYPCLFAQTAEFHGVLKIVKQKKYYKLIYDFCLCKQYQKYKIKNSTKHTKFII